MIRLRKNGSKRQKKKKTVTLNAWMSMHNDSERQTKENDGFKCQIEDMALNSKLKTYDDGSEC